MMTFQVGIFVLAAAAAHVSARPAAVPVDACHVLTRQDVAAVQGEPFTSTKLSTHGEISQCFYQLPTFVKSVSVDVIREGGREFWEGHFERAAENEEPGEEARPPRRISGVGDEAFWVSSRVAGSLYARKGSKVVRVSVGGPGTESQKLAQSKRLLLKALRRL